jgi:hypothetical protein
MSEAIAASGRRAGPIGDLCRRLLPSWPLVIALAALGRVLADPQRVLRDPDTYLHLAAGRWILAHAALPVRDPFSYTMAGAPWVPHEWLSETVLAGVYGLAGWGGLVLLTAVSFAVAMAILTRFLLRDAEPFSTLIAVILGAALTLGHVLARPHILAFPLLVLWSGELFAARERGEAPAFWLLPVMTLWANLHGGFMFGLALAGFIAVEAFLFPAAGCSRAGEARRWGVFLLLATIAALLTPNGADGLIQPLRLMAMPALQASFVEWRSPDFQQFWGLELWLLGILALGFATGIVLPPLRLLLLLGLCHMALQHVRHAELLGLVAPLALAPTLGPRIAARLRRLPASGLSRAVFRLAAPAGPAAAALAVAAGLAIALPVLLKPIARPEGPATPAGALAAAGRIGVSGPVFNSEGFGGYLIFNGVPPFIDGRIEMYGNAFLARYLKAEAGDAAALRKLLDRYHVRWTLLAPQQGAAMRMAAMPGWRRVYAGADAVVDVRAAAPPR